MREFNFIYFITFVPMMLLLAIGIYLKNPNIYIATLSFTKACFYLFIAIKVITINPISGEYIGLAPTTVTLGQTLIFIISIIECLSNASDIIFRFSANEKPPVKSPISIFSYMKAMKK